MPMCNANVECEEIISGMRWHHAKCVVVCNFSNTAEIRKFESYAKNANKSKAYAMHRCKDVWCNTDETW